MARKKEFRKRTDIPAFKEMYLKICNQLDALVDKSYVRLNKEDKLKCVEALKYTIENIINVLITLSEQLHDYKDRELNGTLDKLKDSKVDLSKK